jgi:enamine deaminase RidA (YjgF/YER057c/UK114 family)
MYLLNGDRIYIKPVKVCGTFTDELQNCLSQLSQISSEKKIFKLNFFVDSHSAEDYTNVRQIIHHEVKTLFSDEILLSIIAQPPLAGKIIIEASFFDPTFWKTRLISKGENGAVLFENEGSRVLIGNVQSYKSIECRINAEEVFLQLTHLLNTVGLPMNSIVRQWNYIGNILGFDGQEQHYQAFNDVRSSFYGDSFADTGFPAATGIGMNEGGVIIEFIAIQSIDLINSPINNSEQIAAHEYSEKVLVGKQCTLKTTPKFERARYLELYGKKVIFISGTASILGEHTVGIGNPAEQTEITISNIRHLFSEEVLSKITSRKLSPKYGHARVYIKNRKDYSAIRKTFKSHFGNLPVVYIIADICRPELLVEIEGKVILE